MKKPEEVKEEHFHKRSLFNSLKASKIALIIIKAKSGNILEYSNFSSVTFFQYC